MGVGASGLPPAGDQANAVISGQITAVGPQAPFAFLGPMNFAIWASVNTTLTTTAGSLAATVASATGLASGNSINSVNVPPGTTVGVLSGTNVTLAIPPVTLPGIFNTSSAQVTLPAGSNVAALVGSTVTVPSNAEGATIPAGTTVLSVLQADVAPTNISPGVPGIIVLSALPTLSPALSGGVPLQFTGVAAAITVTGADTKATFTGPLIVWAGTINLERSFDGGKTWVVCNIGGSGQLAQYTAGPISVSFGEPERNVLYRINCIIYTSGTINYRVSATGQLATSWSLAML